MPNQLTPEEIVDKNVKRWAEICEAEVILCMKEYADLKAKALLEALERIVLMEPKDEEDVFPDPGEAIAKLKHIANKAINNYKNSKQ